MSTRQVDVQEVLSRYAAGFFPLYDPWDRFYWERLPLRAVMPVNAQAAALALRMKKRAWKKLAEGCAKHVQIRHTTAVEQVLRLLQDEQVKEHSWVRQEVVRIYQALHAAGVLETIEVWCGQGAARELVGGLLGIVMPGTFVAETMFGLVPEASKLCVCQLVEECWNGGDRRFEMIDVQTPHDLEGYALIADVGGGGGEPGPEKTAHPCIRLGEQTLLLRNFVQAMTHGWKRAFRGGVAEWLAAAAALQRAARGERNRVGAAGIPAEELKRAYRMLRHTLPEAFEPVFE